MTQTIKKTLILILSALLSISALFFVAPTIAKAEDYSDVEIFNHEIGCQISPELKVYREGVGESYLIRFPFSFKEDYAHFSDIKKFANEIVNREGGKLVYKDTYQVYEFTLRSRGIGTEVGEDASKKIVTMRIVFGFNDNGETSYAVSMYRHDLAYSMENFDYPVFTPYKAEAHPKEVIEIAEEGGFDCVISRACINETGPELYLGKFGFVAYLSSYAESYDVQFKFRAQRKIEKGLFNLTKKTDTYKAKTITSDTRSIKQWLETSYNEGLLQYEVEPEVYEEALKIATGIEFKDIFISYLVPVENTPFATMKTQKVEHVPVNGTSVNIEDVKRLAKTDFPIFDTKAHSFINTTSVNYKANYITDSKVEAETQEGKKATFYFDLNTSFADVFLMARDTGLISQEDFEYTLDQVYKRYPETMGSVESPLIYEKDLYGRFGMISMPTINTSIESIFSKVFDSKTQACHLNLLTEVEGKLTKAQYQQLLDEYDYSVYKIFWESAFNVATGQDEYEAKHFLFFAESGEAEIKDKDPTDDLVQGGKDLLKGIGGFFKNVTSGLGAFFGSKGGTTTIVILAIAGVGIYVAFRMGAFKGLFKGGNSSKKRKK